jgi:hypothetical protein
MTTPLRPWGFSFRDCPAARVCDLHPDPLATTSLDEPRPGQSLAHQHSRLTDRKSFGRLGTTVQLTRQNAERSPLFVIQLRHCTPVRLSRCGYSCQFGRASAPTIPQPVHTIRGPSPEDYFATITSEALITARTSSPSFKPRSTASFSGLG